MGGRILVVEDEEGVRSFLVEALSLGGHTVLEAPDGQAALEVLARESVHVVLTDLKMPRVDGMALLERLQTEQPEVEVIMLTAHGAIEHAVEAMKLGAFDFLQKPVSSLAELRLLVDRALERHRLRTHSEATRSHEVKLSDGAPAMKPVVNALARVAKTQATVLLLGESGTGKEVAARWVHGRSDRREGAFIAVNCAALSSALLESELFGHEKGAFTGAHARRRGKLELAAGGTFFLDEVGELQPELQAKLLRVLQEQTFERVGGSQTIQADVRWIAATNRDLEGMVAQRGFREDLYHRLAVFPIALPPLRDRPEDIEPLAKRLLARACASLGRGPMTLDPAAYEVLRSRHWSGNVRELANTLERAAILSDGDMLTADVLQWPHRVTPSAISADEPRPLADVEREAIQHAMKHYQGNRKQVAAALGIAVRTLYDKLRRHEL